jgi:hypothetical protein
MMGVFAEFERAMIQEGVRAGLARGHPPSWMSVSGTLWRLLEGQACGRSPNGSGLILALCSGSAALSRQSRPAREAKTALAAAKKGAA